MLRQIFFIVTYVASLIGTFVNPVFGVMGYIFEWGHHPPLFWWGSDWPDLRWSLLISVVLLVSFAFRYGSLKKLITEKFTIWYWLLGWWIVMIYVSKFFAVDDVASWDKVSLLPKLALLYFLIAKTPRIPKHYKWIIWMFLFVAFDFGQIATFEGKNRMLKVSGPGAGDENAVSSHVLTAIPFLILYFFEGKKWEKFAAVISLPFILNLIILGNSRGAMLAVAAMIITGIFVSRGKVRRYFIVGLVVGSAMFLYLTNDQFWERQESISSYQKDGSASGRLKAWAAAFEMLKDYPLGAGGGGFDELNVDYVPEFAARNHGKGQTVHNTFLLVLTEWGVPGFIFFMGFIIHSLIIMLRIRKDAIYTRDPGFYATEGTALFLGMVGILAAGFFINRPYAEVIYWLSAFAIALRDIQFNEIMEVQDEIAELEEQEEETPQLTTA